MSINYQSSVLSRTTFLQISDKVQFFHWWSQTCSRSLLLYPGGHHPRTTSLFNKITWSSSSCSLLYPGGHHPRTTSIWTRSPWSTSSCSLHFPGGRRCPCSKWSLLPMEESSDSAWRSSRMSEERESQPKGKGDTPEGWNFLPLDSALTFLANCQRKGEWSLLFVWSIAFLSVVVSVVNQIPCDQGVLPKHVMDVWEGKINEKLELLSFEKAWDKIEID